jgi:hypothetical protein
LSGKDPTNPKNQKSTSFEQRVAITLPQRANTIYVCIELICELAQPQWFAVALGSPRRAPLAEIKALLCRWLHALEKTSAPVRVGSRESKTISAAHIVSKKCNRSHRQPLHRK